MARKKLRTEATGERRLPRVALTFELHPKQRQCLFSEANERLFGGCAGGGKAARLSSVVQTPFGERRLGDLRVGERICSPNGTTTKVIYLHPIQRLPVFRVAFNDGTFTDTTGNHLWRCWRASVKRKRDRRQRALFEKEDDKGFLCTTEQLKDLVESSFYDVKIPITLPVQFTKSYRWEPRPIHPYVLGVLIGDGSLTASSASFSTADKEIVDRLKELGVLVSQRANRYAYGIVDGGNIFKALETLGLNERAEHKFIPAAYKLLPLADRYELVHGLMDTDGYADDRGHVQYCTVSEKLAEDLAWVLRSLGCYVKITTKIGSYSKDGETIPCQKVYMLYIQSRDNEKLFYLSRKRERCRGKRYNGGVSEIGRRVVSVELVDEDDCRCITVDHPNGLYMTNDFIVTHNSFLARVESCWWAYKIPNCQVFFFRRLLPDLIKNHVEGPKGFRAILHPWVEGGACQIVEDEIRFWNNSRIFLCHCHEEKDVHKYLSSEMHVLIVEEATQFSEYMIRFLRSRSRVVGLDIPAEYKKLFPRILYTSNPGGVGHLYFKRAFIDSAAPEEIWQTPPEEGGLKRQFMPAKLMDNPSMMTDDPMYENRLRGLGSPDLVRAYLHGDWGAVLGAYYPEFSFDKHVLFPFTIPDHWTRFRVMDWGSYDPCAVTYWCVSSEETDVRTENGKEFRIPEGSIICYRELYLHDGQDRGLKMTVEQVGAKIIETEQAARGREEFAYSVAGKDLFDRQFGPSGAENLGNMGLYFRKADTERVAGWQELRRRMVGTEGRPTIYCFNTCVDAIRTIPTAQHDTHKREDMAKGIDHILDCWRYAAMSRPYASQKREEKPTEIKTLNKMTYNEIIALHEASQRLKRFRRPRG